MGLSPGRVDYSNLWEASMVVVSYWCVCCDGDQVIMEMTGSFELEKPVLLAAVIAFGFSRRFGLNIYDSGAFILTRSMSLPLCISGGPSPSAVHDPSDLASSARLFSPIMYCLSLSSSSSSSIFFWEVTFIAPFSLRRPSWGSSP